MGFMRGKRVLIVGVASKLSIAYGIAAAMSREGAELAFTYQNEKLKKRVEEFAASFGSSLVFPCDVAQDADIDALFSQLSTHWDSLDSLVHSVAFAPSDQLEGDFVDVTTREGFRIAHDISSYSLFFLSLIFLLSLFQRPDFYILYFILIFSFAFLKHSNFSKGRFL